MLCQRILNNISLICDISFLELRSSLNLDYHVEDGFAVASIAVVFLELF